MNNRFLFDVLREGGRGDIALKMLQRREYPSYGYMYFNALEPARECMWELPDAPFEGEGMNSRNHHMFSSVGKYLLDHLAGLHTTSGGRLMAFAGSFEGHANITIQSARGEATLEWEFGEHSDVKIAVPVGMIASVHVPLHANGVSLLGEGALVTGAALPQGVLEVD